MPVSRTYRCLNCMEGTVTRSYDVSHLTRTCDVCGEFDRHVNQRVVDQYEAFEADPPDALDWASLDRTRKLVVAERVARHGRPVESLARDGERHAVEAPEAADTADDRTPVDAAIAGESADTTAPDDAESTEAADRDPEGEPNGSGDGNASAESDPAERDPDGETNDAENGPESETESSTGTGHDSTPSGSD